MPEQTNTHNAVTAGLDAPPQQEDASSVQDWQPGLKPRRTTGWSLSGRRTLVPAMSPAPQHSSTTHKLYLPASFGIGQ
jgi:hypothetical protein